MRRASQTRRSTGRRLGAGLVALAAGAGRVAAPPAPLRAQPAGPEVTVTEYPLPTPGAAPFGIALGPDGAVWFAELSGRQVGRIAPDGALTEYPIPSGNSSRFVAVGPDGAVWFTSGAGNRIGRVAADGWVTEYPLPAEGSDPNGITAGPDGALWFTEQAGNRIGRMTTGGS
jgi:virginiamycin B lyase